MQKILKNINCLLYSQPMQRSDGQVRIGHVFVTDHLPPYNESCTQNVKQIDELSSPEPCKGF